MPKITAQHCSWGLVRAYCGEDLDYSLGYILGIFSPIVNVGPHKYCNTSLFVCVWVCAGVCIYGKSIKAKHGTLEKPD